MKLEHRHRLALGRFGRCGFRGRFASIALILSPLFGFLHVYGLELGGVSTLNLFGYELLGCLSINKLGFLDITIAALVAGFIHFM